MKFPRSVSNCLGVSIRQEMRAFVKWQLSLLAEGKITTAQLGAWAYKLPKQAADGGPAPVPKEIIPYLWGTQPWGQMLEDQK